MSDKNDITPLESLIRQQAIARGINLYLKQGETKPRKRCPRRCNYSLFKPDGSIWEGTSS